MRCKPIGFSGPQTKQRLAALGGPGAREERAGLDGVRDPRAAGRELLN
ncbi:MAG: hypothetical protein OXK77_14695 [Gemmatimonadota bacterium]|nr:hypothetical protein [Gemmatimonadota bacterium]MDE2866558.1 hypothetical protein [Gemmatimonadota bacterium]